jgi:predicted metal-dependent hydrolase
MIEAEPRPKRPYVLALTEDLFLTPRLEDAARAAGFELQVVARPEDWGAGGEPSQRSVPLTEPLEGPEAVLVRRLVTDRPALILVDLTSTLVPWERWISVIKSSAATRRIPIVAFGPHVAEQDLARAERAGADRTLPRGAFLASATDQIQELAFQPDAPAIESACRQPISEQARHGLELLNHREFFEAHEVLEHALMAEAGEASRIYRVLLQLAVAYHHLSDGNRRGAVKLLLRIRPWLDPLPDVCRGIDVAAIRRVVTQLQDALDRLPADAATTPLADEYTPIPWAAP